MFVRDDAEGRRIAARQAQYLQLVRQAATHQVVPIQESSLIAALHNQQRHMQTINPCGEVALGQMMQMCAIEVPPPEKATLVQRAWDWLVARVPARAKKSKLAFWFIDNDRAYRFVRWWYYKVLKRSPPTRGFRRFTMPLIRRVYPQLLADRLVGVQPMTAPTGLVTYLRHRYAEQGNARPPGYYNEQWANCGRPTPAALQRERDSRHQQAGNDDRPDIYRHGL